MPTMMHDENQNELICMYPHEYNKLISELDMLKEKIRMAKNCVVCAGIASADEVCENTYKILDD